MHNHPPTTIDPSRVPQKAMQVSLRKELVQKYCAALGQGEPLVPSGKWNADDVLAATVALYAAAEEHFMQIQPDIPEIGYPPTKEARMRLRGRDQCSQFAVQSQEIIARLPEAPEIIVASIEVDRRRRSSGG
jgi:hypothetical protein